MEKRIFEKKEANYIKGIAIIMMICHHVLTFPTWWPNSFVSSSTLNEFARIFQFPLRLCVSLFAFITGYSLYIKTEELTLKEKYRYSIKSIIKLLIYFWVSLFVIYTCSEICYPHSFDLGEVIFEAFGLTNNICLFSWYVPFYIVTMLVVPLILTLIKGSKVDAVIYGLIVPIFLARILSFFTNEDGMIIEVIRNFIDFYPCVFFGYYSSCYNLFEKIDSKINAVTHSTIIKSCIIFGILVVSFFGRYLVYDITLIYFKFMGSDHLLELNMDMFYSLLFIYSLNYFLKKLDKKYKLHFLNNLSRHSTSMWFIHSIPFNSYTNPIKRCIYSLGNPILVIMVFIIITYGISYLLDLLNNKICNTIDEII